MIPDVTPKKWLDEFNHLFDIFRGCPEDVGFDIIVEKYGTAGFKQFYLTRQNKKQKLREKGIYVN